MAARPIPLRAASAGASLPAWLVQVRAEQEHVRRVRASASAYAIASGARAASPAAKRGRTARAAGAVAVALPSLDMVNVALQDAAFSDFEASQSEAAFRQAGVVAPPDSLTGETPLDFGEGF